MTGDQPLADKVALVTGSSSGAGAAIALELARRGATVAVHCRSRMEEARAIVGRIVDAGGKAAPFRADLAQDGATRTLAADVASALGSIQILVNNAGPFADAPFRSLKPEVWDAIMAANLKAPYLLVQATAADMERLGWGRIINIGATSGFVRTQFLSTGWPRQRC
jgi:NAD(P)-dependent dehydrogenase (short-subunit alcohol dehydrogenase family)